MQQRTRNGTRTHYRKVVQDSDAYMPVTDGKIKRASRFRNFVPKFLSAHCFKSVSDIPSR
jgi:hypothetical protein